MADVASRLNRCFAHRCVRNFTLLSPASHSCAVLGGGGLWSLICRSDVCDVMGWDVMTVGRLFALIPGIASTRTHSPSDASSLGRTRLSFFRGIIFECVLYILIVAPYDTRPEKKGLSRNKKKCRQNLFPANVPTVQLFSSQPNEAACVAG